MSISRPDWTDGPRETPGSVPAAAEIDDAVIEQEVAEEDARRDAEMARLGIAPQAGQVRTQERAPTLATVNAELRTIDQLRRTDRAAYFKNEGMQKRELELLEMRERLKGGAPAAGDGKPSTELASIDAELAEIQRVMRADRPRYELEFAGRHLELLAEKERLGLGTTSGLPPEVLDEWRNTGGVEHHLKVAQDTARVAFDALEGQELTEFQQSFDALPEAVLRGSIGT